MFYAIFGWIYEVFLEVVVYRWGFSNRGVLFGPYCPVYGFGALAFLFTVYPLIKGKELKKKLNDCKRAYYKKNKSKFGWKFVFQQQFSEL